MMPYKIKKDCPEQLMGRELMVFDTECDRVHVLNESSALIWKCLKAGLDEEGIERRLQETYDLESVNDLSAIIRKALRSFQDKGLIEQAS